MVPVKRWSGSIIVLVLLIVGCWQSSPPLQPDEPVISSEKDGTVFFHRWRAGPTVMICCDIVGGRCEIGNSTSGSPLVLKVEGNASAKDGRRLDWKLETSDGRSIKCWVNGKEYDISKGSLFLVKTKGGKMQVEQLNRDLSGIQADEESCRRFVRTDPAMSKLLGADGE